MTTSYKCDICGTLNEFDTNNVVAHSDEKFADLCNECKDSVLEFIKDERENYRTPEDLSEDKKLELAKVLLHDNGFVIYKPAPTRNRRKGSTK